jgi:hypothetical protein
MRMHTLHWGTLSVEVKDEIADALWDLQAAVSEAGGAATVEIPASSHGNLIRLRLALSPSAPLALSSIPWSTPGIIDKEQEMLDVLRLQRSLVLANGETESFTA